MKFYLAASFKRRDEMQENAQWLKDRGHEITSRWHSKPENDFPPDVKTSDVPVEFLKEESIRDLDDIEDADMILVFNEEGPSRGGFRTEMGYAMGCGVEVYLIGPRTCVFDYHYSITQSDTFGAFIVGPLATVELDEYRSEVLRNVNG